MLIRLGMLPSFLGLVSHLVGINWKAPFQERDLTWLWQHLQQSYHEHPEQAGTTLLLSMIWSFSGKGELEKLEWETVFYCPYSEFWILKASLQMSMIAPWSMVTKKAYFRQFNTTSVPMSTTACVADINSLRRKTGFLFDCTFLYTHISLFPWHLYT